MAVAKISGTKMDNLGVKVNKFEGQGKHWFKFLWEGLTHQLITFSMICTYCVRPFLAVQFILAEALTCDCIGGLTHCLKKNELMFQIHVVTSGVTGSRSRSRSQGQQPCCYKHTQMSNIKICLANLRCNGKFKVAESDRQTNRPNQYMTNLCDLVADKTTKLIHININQNQYVYLPRG